MKPSATSSPDDVQRYGYRLLTKMGWGSGKGLGKNEDGIKDFIKVRQKNDNKGIGYNVKVDDLSYLEHLTTLLNVLNGSDKSEQCKIQSLEKKSKSSRNRLHYHKFIRGKDLSSCSEQELACILGKSKSKKLEEIDELDNKGREDNNLLVSKLNMNDYFSQKLATLKLAEVEKKRAAHAEPFEDCHAVVLTEKRKKSAGYWSEEEDQGDKEISCRLTNSPITLENAGSMVASTRRKRRKKVKPHQREERVEISDIRDYGC